MLQFLVPNVNGCEHQYRSVDLMYDLIVPPSYFANDKGKSANAESTSLKKVIVIFYPQIHGPRLLHLLFDIYK